MSRRRAPTALRMPISRVRSRTETSMMFMIPMPPTISEIEAMPPSSSVSVPLIALAVWSSCDWSKIEKSSSSVAARPWRDRRSVVISAWTAVICAWSATLTPIVRTSSPATKYLLTMPIGTMTWSSGSWKPEPPLGWRMPISRNGRPPTVISLPIELASSLRSSAVVAPSTATRRFCSTEVSVRNEPCHTS